MGIRRTAAIVFILLLTVTLWFVPKVNAGPYRDYSTIITAFKALAASYPTLMTYETVGKTVENRSIIMFKIGNSNGGKVLFDGGLHGWESLGGEVLYYYAKWLLTSDDPLANRILERDCTLLIPALNTDRYNIGRQNANGVDLNRNFATDWKYGSSNPDSDEYRGPSSLSEPESKTLVNIFQTRRPSFYVNLHGGASELFASSYNNRTYCNSLFDKIQSLSKDRGVTPYYHAFLSGVGFAIGDGARAGVTSFLLEVSDQTQISTSEVETVVLPRFIPVAVTLSQACENAPDFMPWDPNRDGKIDIQDISIVSKAYASFPGLLNWDLRADVVPDRVVDIRDLALVSAHYGEQY